MKQNNRSWRRHAIGATFSVAFLVVVATTAHAATPLTQLSFSPDTTVLLGNAATVVNPSLVVRDDLSPAPGGLSTVLTMGGKLLAYHKMYNGLSLFVLDSAATLASVLATPRSVMRLDPATGTSSIFFDGAANGVPDGAMIDAVALINDTDLLLSFDVAVALPGGVYADPRDLVRFNVGTGKYSLYFNGAAAGIPEGVNLQDVHYFDHNGHLLMTFDSFVIFPAAKAFPSNVLEFTAPSTWENVYAGHVRDPRWNSDGGSSDLVSLYAESLRKVLDVDGNTAFTGANDALLVARYLLGLTGSALTNNALSVAPAATRTDPTLVLGYLDTVKPFLDVDGNGKTDALTDGLLIARYLLGLRGATLVTGAVASDATRTTAQIEKYIDQLTK